MCTHVYMLSRFKNNVTAVLRGSGMFGTYGWYVRMVGTVFLVQPWYGRLVRTVFLGQPLVRTIGAYGFFLVQVLVQDIGTDGQKVLVSASLLALPQQFHRDHTHFSPSFPMVLAHIAGELQCVPHPRQGRPLCSDNGQSGTIVSAGSLVLKNQ